MLAALLISSLCDTGLGQWIADNTIQGPVSHYDTAHFRVLYTTAADSDDAVPPERPAVVAAILEEARDRFLALGFSLPELVIPVRLMHAGSYSFPLVGLTLSKTASPSLIAHELFHQVEYAASPALGANYFSSDGYDAFSLEGGADAGADLVYPEPPSTRMLSAPDADFWAASYEASYFWAYFMHNNGGVPAFADYWRVRGERLTTKGALAHVLGGEDALDVFISKLRMAMAVPEVAHVALEPGIELGATVGYEHSALYFAVSDGAPHSLRVVAGSQDLAVHLVSGTDARTVTSLDGVLTVQLSPSASSRWVIVESRTSTPQPFFVELDADGPPPTVPTIRLRCSGGSAENAAVVVALVALFRRRRRAFWTAWLLGIAACGTQPREQNAPAAAVTASDDPQPTEQAPAATGATRPTSEPSLDSTAPDETPPPPPPPPPPSPEPPARYSPGALHSPLTPRVVAGLRSVYARGPGLPRFTKVGDSITVSPSFLSCFGGANIDYGSSPQLAASVSYFAGSFERTSLSAKGGWAAFNVLGGSPSRLLQEITAFDPSFAVVMLGTNDSAYDPKDYDFFAYADDMFEIVDTLLAHGAVPIVSSIPPRANNATAAARVPQYNRFLRALAEARQIPFVDYHAAMTALPGQGLSGDGVHPNVAQGAPCHLSEPYGYNARNALTLAALDRVRTTVVDGAQAFDAPSLPLAGVGTLADPIVIDRLPFSAIGDTRLSSKSALDSYPGCDQGQDESGGEIFYRLDLAAATTVTALVVDPGAADIDVHVLTETQACLARAHRQLSVHLAAGRYLLSLDTFVTAAGPRAGEYLLLLSAE